MTELDTTATFQQARSEFAEIVRFLINELARNITSLEDHMLMKPQMAAERPSERDPYREFRRAFRDLYLLTFNTVRPSDLRTAVEVWFHQPYKTETKTDIFLVGISFAEQYLTQMYQLGLLDLNVSEPVDFPFEDMIRDVAAEQARQVQSNMDISRSNISLDGLSPLIGNQNLLADISEDQIPIESLVNLEDPSYLVPEHEDYDMFEDEKITQEDQEYQDDLD